MRPNIKSNIACRFFNRISLKTGKKGKNQIKAPLPVKTGYFKVDSVLVMWKESLFLPSLKRKI